MTPSPRQEGLLAEVRRAGTMSLEGLAKRFGITVQTVRRDLRLLAEAGLIARFHGGVRPLDPGMQNMAYEQRRGFNVAGKEIIAKSVAKELPHGCSLILSTGTTVEAIARELVRHEGLCVVTNNLNVATIMSANANCEVIVASGELRAGDRAIVGEATIEFFAKFRVDFGLIGVSCIEHDGTLRDFNYDEVQVTRAIMAHSRQVWLAADSTKFKQPAMVELGHVGEVDVLFTDETPALALRTLPTAAGVRWVVAGPAMNCPSTWPRPE